MEFDQALERPADPDLLTADTVDRLLRPKEEPG